MNDTNTDIEQLAALAPAETTRNIMNTTTERYPESLKEAAAAEAATRNPSWKQVMEQLKATPQLAEDQLTPLEKWKASSAADFVDIDEDGIPAVCSFGGTTYLYEQDDLEDITTQSWNRQAKDDNDKINRAIGYKLLESPLAPPKYSSLEEIPKQVVDDTRARAFMRKALNPSTNQLAAAELQTTDLATGKHIKGAPWKDFMVQPTHNRSQPIKLVQQKRKIFTPRGKAPLKFGTGYLHSEPTHFIKFLQWMLRDNKAEADLLAALIGRTLVADTFTQKLPLLIGPGGNGKGVLFKIIKALLGPQLVTSPKYSELTKNFSYTAHCKGKILLTLDDLPDRPKGIGKAEFDQALAFIKNITGGDSVSAETKYQPHAQEVQPQLTIWIATNFKPKWIKGLDDIDSWTRRLIPFRCNQKPETINPRLAQQIIKEDGLNQIALWCTHQYQEWIKQGTPLPASTQKLLTQITTEQLKLKERFFIEATEHTLNPEHTTTNTQIYEAFKNWTATHGEPIKDYIDPNTAELTRGMKQQLANTHKQLIASYNLDGALTTKQQTKQITDLNGKKKRITIQIWKGLKIRPEYQTKQPEQPF